MGTVWDPVCLLPFQLWIWMQEPPAHSTYLGYPNKSEIVVSFIFTCVRGI